MMIIESALLKIDIYILGVNNRVLLVDGCCQCNANQSPKFASQQVLGSDQLAPEVMLDAVDLYEDFIEMPLPLCDTAHIVSTRFADLLCEVSSEAINP